MRCRMTDLEQLAELIFPDVKETIEDLEKGIHQGILKREQLLLDLLHHQRDFFIQVVFLQL